MVTGTAAATASPPSTATNSPTTRTSPTARPRGNAAYSRRNQVENTNSASATKEHSKPAHAERSHTPPHHRAVAAAAVTYNLALHDPERHNAGPTGGHASPHAPSAGQNTATPPAERRPNRRTHPHTASGTTRRHRRARQQATPTSKALNAGQPGRT